MSEKKPQHENMKAMRWNVEDWEMLAKIAARVGLSRSAFVKRAALGEAGLVLAGAAPHYVSGPQASTHNGGAKTFSNAKQTTKRVPEEIGASAEVKPKPADARKKPTPKAG